MWPATTWNWLQLIDFAGISVRTIAIELHDVYTGTTAPGRFRGDIGDFAMPWQTWALAILIVAFAAIQYTLAWSAIVDLLHRPRVRGNSHMYWALIITCVPIVGALAYGAIGPTSFKSTQMLRSVPETPAAPAYLETDRPANVTAFRKYSGKMSDHIPAQRPGVTRSRAHGVNGAVSRIRRPGA